MPEIYKLHLQPAVGDEQPAVTFELFQADDITGDLVTVDSVAWSEANQAILQDDPLGDPEIKYWHCALADETKGFKIVPQSALGVSRKDEYIYPARPTTPGTCSIIVTAKSKAGVPLDGVSISIAIARTPAIVNGAFVDNDPTPYVTGASIPGVATAIVVAGPAYHITSKILGKTITVETKDQTSVNVALIAAA